MSRLCPSVSVLLLWIVCTARGDFSVYWDFSDGLSGWTWDGNASSVDGRAVLADGDASQSVLYRGAVWNDTMLQLKFDLQEYLAPTPVSPFPDSAFVSLYFTDDMVTFDLGDPPLTATALIDIQSGNYTVHRGSLGPGPEGSD